MAELLSFGDAAPFVPRDASETIYDSMRNSKKRRGGDIVALFVHAGAGYHSFENEHVHLEACSEATSMGMKFLKAGSTAAEAVEAAIRVLEDNEITNAGYGSNLAMDGTVENDACIVDHYGRSGGVGALGQVMHPIHVARLLLEGSTKKLTLRRVPPNLLVGQGAIDFAFENNVPILMPDSVVSQAAKERYKRWQKDLADASDRGDLKYVPAESHTPEKQLLAPLVNEAQPVTPVPFTNASHPAGLQVTMPTGRSPHRNNPSGADMFGRDSSIYDHYAVDGDASQDHHKTSTKRNSSLDTSIETVADSSYHVGSDVVNSQHHYPVFDPNINADGSSDSIINQENRPLDDVINDTVGAIAIDGFGNIAAGSSSGGIGMKRRGRIGPAALVGVGTAIHPVNPDDKCKKTTAVVTSGTGEHMATTLAAGTCADRLYYGLKASEDGNLVDANDEEILQSFVEDDFMSHPSVRFSNTAAAIGVLAVKKTSDGVWFHFAHNTDSFAICTMTSEDAEPLALMSRGKSGITGRNITTGARSCTWRQPREDSKDTKRQKKSPAKDSKHSAKEGRSTSKKSRFMHMAFNSTDGSDDMPSA